MKQKFMNNEFLCLCYHYIRPEKNKDPFPRILGTNLNEFKNHLSKLIDFYKIISVDDVFNFLIIFFALFPFPCKLLHLITILRNFLSFSILCIAFLI